jgi:uncharacterized protein
MRRWSILLILPLALAVSGFKLTDPQPVPAPDQPPGERNAQDQLPQSKDPLWGKLARCPSQYDTKTSLYAITLTPEVKALDGTDVTTQGFVLPLDGLDNTKHFLLTRRTPVCLFCPPGEPNEVIEVHAKKAVAWGDDMVTLKGRFKLVNDGEKAIFFTLDDAEQSKGK